MADKEATVYIVDVGRSMGKKRHGRDKTDLQWAMTWIWDKITSVVATERKTLLQGVIALKTDGTNNKMDREDDYQNISVLHELSQILLPDLKNLRRDIQPSSTNRGDAISALALALAMIDDTCKKLKYRRKVVLVTNGEGTMDLNGLEEFTKKINQDSIELVILGLDFDDEEYGFKEEDKDAAKQRNERTLKQFADDCSGVFGTLAQAVEELGEPRLRETRPVPSYKGQLTLGSLTDYPETSMAIDVERYPRTMIRRPQTASSFATLGPGASGAQTDTAMGDGDGQDGDEQAAEDLSTVRNHVSYFVSDDSAPDGKLRVEREDLARGYEYGRTAVHISEIDEDITKLESKTGLEVIGFIPWANYERYMGMSNTHVVVASRSNSKAIMALSSFIHALFELESYAVTRLVTKDGKEPTVELLAPLIEPDYECLLNVNLPFAEDFRQYKFPPLDRVMTVSGKVLKEHRLLPDDRLMDAMDAYMDSMDLSSFAQDDDGRPAEYLRPQDAFSPVLHHIDQAVRWRAVHPDDAPPEPYESLTRFREPPRELQAGAATVLKKLAAAADVKKVPPKFVGRRRKESTKPLSGLDVDALLNGRGKRAVDPNNAIPSFKQMLEAADDPNAIADAARQMAAVVETRIKNSFGEASYEQALEEMKVLRGEMRDMEEPARWNRWVKKLKEKLLGTELGEGRDEFWFLVRRARLGLLDGDFPGGGGATQEEAADFLRTRWEV